MSSIPNLLHLNVVNGPVNTGTPAALAAQLAKRADTNGDGQVSTAEFSQFLQGLLDEPETTAASQPAPKGIVLKILSGHSPTTSGLRDALATIQRALPGTTLAGDDALSIPGLGRVTVGQFGGGVPSWCWTGRE